MTDITDLIRNTTLIFSAITILALITRYIIMCDHLNKLKERVSKLEKQVNILEKNGNKNKYTGY